MKLRLIPLLLIILVSGCDSVGRHLATLLPEKDGGSKNKLDASQDGNFIDPTQIGGDPSASGPANMPIGNEQSSLYGDPTQGGEYQQMMQDTADIGMDPGQAMGAFVGEAEYAEAMSLDEPNTGAANMDPASEYQLEVGEFAIPDTSEGADVTSQYITQGGLTDPADLSQGNQDPTAQYLNGGNGGDGPGFQSNPQAKPLPQGAPRKNQPSSRNEATNGNLPSALRPKGGTSRPQTNSGANKEPPISRPPNKSSRKNIQIGIPGNVSPSYANFDAPVAVPQLLERGTSMSFGINLQQSRPLPSQGTVYWVIHSQRNGFSRFELPVRAGELPPRLQGVVPQFTPNSGPFRTFLVLVNESNKVQYLTAAEQIPWNPQ